ncbi:MAG: hypothetical protein AUJ58_00545 [Zetaproteobacteria bacterium CG1_02_55_237]|nr:MAG: hypothetical protein AUJ58_00545 [Zetaproteobacteria bacterium CG1_02_55_237]
MSMRDLMMIMMAVAFLFTGGAEAWAKVAGHFTLIEGRVDVLVKKGDKTIPVKLGDEVSVGDIVRTKSNSRAQITLVDSSLLNLGESSRMEIRRFVFAGGAEKKRDGMFHLFRGQLRSIVHRDKADTEFNFKVETPTAVAAVRGTDYSSNVRSGSLSYFACKTGQVEVHNRMNIGAPVLINANQFTQVAVGFAPTPPRTIPPAMMQNLFNDAPAGGAPSEKGKTETKTETKAKAEAKTETKTETKTEVKAKVETKVDSSASALPALPEAPALSAGGDAAPLTGTPTLPGVSSTPATPAAPVAPVVNVAPVVPVTPPITTTTPSILTAPVTIQVIF